MFFQWHHGTTGHHDAWLSGALHGIAERLSAPRVESFILFLEWHHDALRYYGAWQGGAMRSAAECLSAQTAWDPSSYSLIGITAPQGTTAHGKARAARHRRAPISMASVESFIIFLEWHMWHAWALQILVRMLRQPCVFFWRLWSRTLRRGSIKHQRVS